MDRELLLLRLRNTIADKEFAIAQANMETNARGSWAMDWHREFLIADSKIEELFAALVR